MTQYAIIKKLTGPDTAEAEVLRGTAIGYAIAAAMGFSEGQSIIVSFVFFAAGFLFAALFSRRKSSKPITYEVRDIITSGADTI